MSKEYQNHYDNTKLINSLDADGERPAFYIVCSRERGPGKTFSFSKLLVNNFLEKSEKFILLTRNMGDLGNIASGVLDGYLQVEHPEISVEEKIQMKGVFSKIYMKSGKGEDATCDECGYVIPIRACDQIKKISSMFYDATAFYFDEFQPMANGTYLKDELGLLYNIYKSVARGDGSAIRYMPIYMASNTITLGNPYFEGLGLNGAIQSNTKFYKGHGVVFENCVNNASITGATAAGGFIGQIDTNAHSVKIKSNGTVMSNQTITATANDGRGAKDTVTIEYEDETTQKFEKTDIALIRLALHF